MGTSFVRRSPVVIFAYCLFICSIVVTKEKQNDRHFVPEIDFFFYPKLLQCSVSLGIVWFLTTVMNMTCKNVMDCSIFYEFGNVELHWLQLPVLTGIFLAELF